MKIININLISFKSAKSIGTFVYIKRILEQISLMNSDDFFFYIYLRRGFDITNLQLPSNSKIIYVPTLHLAIFRILFEQVFFYFYLKKADFFYAPCLSLPLFVNSYKILTIHDMVPFILKNKYGLFRKYFIPWMTKIAAHKADLIVTVSYNSKEDIIRLLGIPSTKIKVIYNFILENEAVVSKIERRVSLESYGLTHPFFLNVSTLQPGKNIERLIRAFKIFYDKTPSYQLCIVGNKGWGYEDIYKIVKELNAERVIVFTGYLDDTILSQLYSACIGVVYVSLYEGFGIPPLEGFYHSKGAICSNNSSLPEVVGDAAVLVDPMDDLSIAIGFSDFLEKREILEANATKRVTVFNPKTITMKFLSLFK